MSGLDDSLEARRLRLLDLAFQNEHECNRYVSAFQNQFQKTFERIARMPIGERLRYAATLFDKGEFAAGRAIVKLTFQIVEAVADGAELAQAAEAFTRTVFPSEVKSDTQPSDLHVVEPDS